jgi:ABC-type sugar transport system ATPase subunit
MLSVQLTGVRKRYGDRVVLDVDRFEIEKGEFFVLLGPSGSGKTTLLRILAGLVKPDEGGVQLGGADAGRLAPHERGVGVVFQGLALWPHLTVRGNIALGLDRIVPDRGERAARIDVVAAELDIERFLDVRPGKLSGGEQQRVALARALVRRPRLMLLDEAFSDLDARLRRSTARLVRRLHDEHDMTTLLITHDRTEAYLLADRVGIMRDGRIVALGRPDTLNAEPPGAFAAEFFTDAALVRGQAADGGVETPLGRLAIEGDARGDVVVAVRPDEVVLGEGDVPGTVVACEFAGGPWRCRVRVGPAEVYALSDRARHAGDQVLLAPPAAARRALEDDR